MLAPRLIEAPMAGLYPITMDEANDFLVRVENKLGPVHRPFHQEAFGYEVDGRLVAVATSGSIVNGPVGAAYERNGQRMVPFPDRPEGFARNEVVELTRLAATERWMCRLMVRQWRELCAARWASWPAVVAASYSHNAMHSGDLYRFDGWTKVREDAGSAGGGSWSRKRYATDAAHGSKTLWLWRYAA
jgi:hypothetical protein